jgi:hypothetical protein
MNGPDMTTPEGRAGLTARLNRKTEIVDAESLSSGERIVAPDGRTWLVLGEPEEQEGGELITLRLTVEGESAPEVKRTVTRTTKYEVICK